MLFPDGNDEAKIEINLWEEKITGYQSIYSF